MRSRTLVRSTGSVRRVLILGGTGWLGRAVARAAVADGADVTCFARGVSGSVPDGARLVVADRSDPHAYDAVRGDWDEVVEISWNPAFVSGALSALAAGAAHWTLVSSVSVYRDALEPGADETAPLVEPGDETDYARAKAAAEQVSAAHAGGRLLVARAGLIVGPGDPTDRFGYWPARIAQGGDVLVPAPSDRWVQVIDIDDLAAWIVRAGRQAVTGPVNAVGPAVAFADVLEAARAVAGADVRFVPRTDDQLEAHDVRPWAGPRSLPLWLPAGMEGFARRSDARFRATGGTARALSDTLARVLEDERARGLERERRAGLARADEQRVLADVVGSGG